MSERSTFHESEYLYNMKVETFSMKVNTGIMKVDTFFMKVNTFIMKVNTRDACFLLNIIGI